MTEKLPHEIMLEMAMDENALYSDVIITPEGGAITIKRCLSISEKLGLLKSTAPYYAPTLKSIDQKSSIDVTNLSMEELKTKILAMSKDLSNEQD